VGESTPARSHIPAFPSFPLAECAPASSADSRAASRAPSTQASPQPPVERVVGDGPPPIRRTGTSGRIVAIGPSYPLRVLLAEDNLINQKMMVMMMRKLGYELILAVNGVEVLAALEAAAALGPQHEVECILMDASMDIMDGLECTQTIRAQQVVGRTRPFIIAQTANVTSEYRLRCEESGMDDFLSKPIRIEELVIGLKGAYRAHAAVRKAARAAAASEAPSTPARSNPA
jgi:CheY-like chemotaxis protein